MADSFAVTVLEDVMECLHMNLHSSQSRFTSYLESTANATMEENQVYALKFENIIFHYYRFQADDIKEKALTPYFTPSSWEGENFISIYIKIPIYGIDKLLNKGKKKNAMTPQKIARQMRELKLKGMRGPPDGMDESA